MKKLRKENKIALTAKPKKRKAALVESETSHKKRFEQLLDDAALGVRPKQK